MQVKNATIGISTELDKKSNKSKNCIPRNVTIASGPYPSDERRPMIIHMKKVNTIDGVLFRLNLSCIIDTQVS